MKWSVWSVCVGDQSINKFISMLTIPTILTIFEHLTPNAPTYNMECLVYLECLK